MKPHIKILLTMCLCVLLSPVARSSDSTVDFDTTRVREVLPVKKSAGEMIADVPGEVLKLPFYALELFSRALIMNPLSSKAMSLFKVRKEKARYVPIAGYSTRAGLKFGVGIRFISRENPTVKLKLKTRYSTNNYQLYRLKYTSPEFFTNRIGLEMTASYRKETRQSLYGIGMLSMTDNEVNLSIEKTDIHAQVPLRIGREVSFQLSGNYQTINLLDGEDPSLEGRLGSILADSSLNLSLGQLDPLRNVRVGIAFEYDGRNSTARPTQGSFAHAGYGRITGVRRSDGKDYDVLDFELQSFLNIWRERTIALRAAFSRVDAEGSRNDATPYYLANRLGGASALRGYSKGRFIDNDVALISVEYRYPVYNYVDAFFFLDEGRVYSDIDKETVFTGWRNSVGFGFRVWNTQRAVAVVQVAHSEESTRFYFELGAAW